MKVIIDTSPLFTLADGFDILPSVSTSGHLIVAIPTLHVVSSQSYSELL